MVTATERIDTLESRVSSLEALITQLLSGDLRGEPGKDGQPGTQGNIGPAGIDVRDDLVLLQERVQALEERSVDDGR